MFDSNKRVLLHLSLITGLGPASILRLLIYVCHESHPELMHIGWYELIKYHNELPLQLVYTLSAAQIAEITKLKVKDATVVYDMLRTTVLLEEELALIQKYNITLLTPFDNTFPEELKQIHHPPMVLYCKGEPLVPVAKRLAIVGSRKATDYAEEVIQSLVPALVGHDWAIVSGGAEGADTMAHHAALKAGGITIAVLGAGLLTPPFPASNMQLFELIAKQGGTIVSPFPLRMAADRTTFPQRNRIISGLSLGSVVVQAAQRSGALITARFALEQGRQVFAVPGPVNDELSYGSHYLIKQGAKLVSSVNDVLEEFGESMVINDQTALSTKHISAQPSLSRATVDAVRSMPDEALTMVARGMKEQDMCPMLATLQEPVTIDELQLKTGMQSEALQDWLFTLQLEGKIKQHFSGTWQRV
ncbi:DNA-protecting protein DprA [Candidatus Dependentiae bacterium]|nr:DNA-protecting protein DprA [Candidatus Dependentiae bacterium]